LRTDFGAGYGRRHDGKFADPAKRIMASFLTRFFSASSSMNGSVIVLADVDEEMIHLTRLALALVAFHRENGSYPEALPILVPHFMPIILHDFYSDDLPRYRRDNGGFTLYSIGPNRKDDGGKKAENADDGDIVVQFP
jgi:hypothetical protein